MSLYDRLADRMNQIASGANKNPALLELLQELFAPEEAAVAIAMPLGTNPLEVIAERAGATPEQVFPILERMADKGLLVARFSRGVHKYNLQPLLPGIFEMQFMKGETTPAKMRMARLFDNYARASREQGGTRPSIKVTPPARVIPIEKEIPSKIEVFAYERVSEFINDENTLGIATCYCRHHRDLVDKSCGAPKDMCMVFGPFAAFLIERGFARKMSTDEMQRTLDRAEKYGLIHVSDNVQERISFICNCCSCCCGLVGALHKYDNPNSVAKSNFLASIEIDSCNGCEACVARCQMDAIVLQDEVAQVKSDRCIGCAVCVSACPTGALSLTRRDVIVPTPATLPDLHRTIFEDRMAARPLT